MTGLLIAAREIQDFCLAQEWKFCIIGGLAVLRWGRARTTRDVDLSLLTEWGDEEAHIDRLLAQFSARRKDAKDFALHARVLLLEASNGVSIDIALAAFPYEREVIERATYYEYAPGVSLFTAAAEDLIVLKAFADRPQDWIDIKGIIARNSTKLDRLLILNSLAPLCELKESPDIVPKLERLLPTGK